MPPLPQPYLDFLDRFNKGEFWESHEVLEGAWRKHRSGFYQGLILIASALVHAQRLNPKGTAAQLKKAMTALAPYAPSYLGLDIDAILRYASVGLRTIAEPTHLTEKAVLPAIHLESREGLVRGDEPELFTVVNRS